VSHKWAPSRRPINGTEVHASPRNRWQCLGSGSETLDAACHDSIYCSQSRLDTLVGIEQYPVDMSPDVGYDPFDRCWETRALTAGPGRREIDVRGPGACGRVGPHVAAIVARRAAHRPAMLGRRTPSRWHIARIIEISHSSKSIISCISIPTISDTAGFGTFRIMLLPCPSADATAIERRSVPGESRPDR
jgi:hypothetical protein